ncbi:BAP_1a_G0014850.mRNA.1.CDS.1 [Saccharomyces cerevisiae]|nr:BAP_1a_G0014850.mRNA.1.CDS.1 [Saccharomyces cerevisiae]CAI7100522.1 BAP_1a_G0014850.mRNA.1.CDS.1 [Saccharomyces cerevisiae]
MLLPIFGVSNVHYNNVIQYSLSTLDGNYFTRGSSSSFESESSKSEPQSTGVLVAFSQFSNDSFITYLNQVFTSTTTPSSAFGKFSHSLTIGTSINVAGKTSDIFSSSSLSTVTTVAHNSSTQHASGTLATEYLTANSSISFENNDSIFALQSTYTNLISISD